MVEHAHEDYVIELSGDGIQLVNRALAKVDVEPQCIGREARLVQIAIIHIDSEDVVSTPAFHLDRIEPAIAADIENRFACKRSGNLLANFLPLDVWKISQEMIWGGVHAVNVQVMEPLSHSLNSMGKFGGIVEVRTVMAACAQWRLASSRMTLG